MFHNFARIEKRKLTTCCRLGIPLLLQTEKEIDHLLQVGNTSITANNNAILDITTCELARKALDYTLLRLARAQLSTFPFPHIFVTNVFPEYYYKEILRNLIDDAPTSGLFKRRGPKKPRYSVDIKRLKIGLTEHSLIGKIHFWNCHQEVFASPRMTQALVNPFENIIRRRFRLRNFDFNSFGQTLLLTQDRHEYFITPHCDVATKFVTNLFYLVDTPEEGNLKSSGTLLLQAIPKGEGATDLLNFNPNKKYLKFSRKSYIFKQASFVRNSMVAFAPCTNAWHAVPLQNFRNDTVRNTLQGFVYYGEQVGLAQC